MQRGNWAVTSPGTGTAIASKKERTQGKGTFSWSRVFKMKLRQPKAQKSVLASVQKKTCLMTRAHNPERSNLQSQSQTKRSSILTGDAAIRGIDKVFEENQIHVTPSPQSSKASPGYRPNNERYRKTADEQIVNTALLNFLKAITEHFEDISLRWTIQRRPFHATVKGEELYEARTDGCLADRSGKSICSLVEVKTAERFDRLYDIFMQESAQIVAWLLNEQDDYLSLPGWYVHNLSFSK